MTLSAPSTEPERFRRAVESMTAAPVRPELSLGPIRPPQRLAPFSHAVGIEVRPRSTDLPVYAEGDAFGRLILLYDPAGGDAWNGTLRLVAYLQADVEDAVAADPLLPEVAWSWLTEALDVLAPDHHSLGGTLTATTSVRFGDIAGPPRAQQLELRASWTASEPDLGAHVQAFAAVLATAAGLPPEGTAGMC